MPLVKNISASEKDPVLRCCPPVRTAKDREKVWKECHGLNDLGLADEARAIIDSLPPGDPELKDFRALRVLLDAWGPEADKAATLGLTLIEQDGPFTLLLDSTCHALLSAGGAKESWSLMQQHSSFLHPENQGYRWSCHASAAGDFDAACRFFLQAVADADSDLPRALLDVDLMPLWEHLATGHLTEAQIHILAHPHIETFLNKHRVGKGPVNIDWQMQRLVTRDCRRWLVQHPVSKLWALSPWAPQRNRWRYSNWQKRLRARNAGLLAQAVRRAQKWFLERQLPWAVEKAEEGNFLGARWHLTWAMAQDPALFTEFETALGRYPELVPVVEDFRVIWQVDPLLLQSMAQKWNLRGLLDRDTLEDWEARILGAQANGLYLAIKANSETAQVETRKAMATLLDLARRWPADPYPWVNLMDLCCEQELWDQARICAQQVPRSAWFFRFFTNLIQKMDQKDRAGGQPFSHTPFYGQKDLGGIMRAPHFEYQPGEE